MVILTVQFDIVGYNDYKVLLSVFESSVKRHMPEAQFVKIILPGEERTSDMRCGKHANTRKLQAWVDYIDNTDENVILADCDMLMVRSAEHAFDQPFDIAYTRRVDGGRIPFNSGIIMVRPNERSREFMHKWLEVNNRMYTDSAFHAKWNEKYKGMNQTAFGYLLETGEHNAHLHAYPTREWNAIDADWDKIGEETVFVHYKGVLRSCVLTGKAPLGSMIYPVSLWRREAGQELAYPYRKLLEAAGKKHSAIVKKRLKRHAAALGKVKRLAEEEGGL